MLYIKSNEEKKLVFEIDIHGCNAEELRGYVRFEMYGAEYGFPVLVEDRKITAVIPPLKEIVEKDIEDGTVINARLDMVTERHYFMPWEGDVKIGAPMGIKAKIKEEKGSGPAIRSKLLTSGSSSPRVVESKQESGDSKVDRLEKMVNMLVEGMGKRVPKKKLLRETKTVRPKKKQVTMEMMEHMSEQQVYNIMERLGTTNPTVKKILYEQAASQTKTGKPAEVLKEIIKIMGRKRIQRRKGLS